MEIASPPASPPPQEFRFDSAGYTAASVCMNPFASTDDVEGNPFLATAVTAPPSPNPFELLPPATAGVSEADPFDLFQHFTSAPASPARAAAIYAQFSSVDDGNGADHNSGDDDDGGFQPRLSYSPPTVTSVVPFDWEEMPGKPKPGFGCAAATAIGDVEDTDFDFGVLLDRSAQTAPGLTTADELFDEGKIRPLKPPPRLLDSGSVGSSPRSPMARAAMWSPRVRSLVGPGADFDPFAAAMARASKAPSRLGAGVKDAAETETAATLPANPDSVTSPRTVPPSTNNGWRKKWRLSDLLLFRRLSAKGRAAGSISTDPVFKYSPVQRLGMPVKNATSAEPEAVNGDVSAGKHKKQSRSAAAGAEGGGMAAPHRQSLMGCVRLNPGLHRLAKGLNGSSSHFGRRAARPAMDG